MQSIALLARFAVTNCIREDDKKLRRIERLIFSKQLTGKLGANKLRAAASGTMHDENSIRRFAL